MEEFVVEEFENRKMIETLCFEVKCKPEPQGSIRAFTPKGWTRPILTSTNPKLKAFRREVAKAALVAMREFGVERAGKNVPICVIVTFYVAPPGKMPKGRIHPTVRPDLDKLFRSVGDALSGVVYEDDAQVCAMQGLKRYFREGDCERLFVTVQRMKEIE